MYLLDTNVVSEFRKVQNNKAHPNFMLWQQGITAQQCFISSVTILEIEQGILKLARKDAIQAQMLRDWFEIKVLTAFEQRVLAFDITIARLCAKLHVPDPRSERDAMIAATAIAHGLTLVSRNVIDFQHMDVNLINPFT